MDSLTQVVLGSSVAAVCVPAKHRRSAVLVGAILGTLPDLDVFLDYGDAVANFTYHRGFSHSLFVLLPFGFVVWAALQRWYTPVRMAPKPWLVAIVLALITHPLLDAHTAYGTQFLWPLSSPPVMWSTIFIIDPLYTLPLLVGVIVILVAPKKLWAINTLAVGLLLSTGYLGWTWAAKTLVANKVAASLPEPVAPQQVFTTPTPFNSLLWRIVVLQGDHYLEGYYSLLQHPTRVEFQALPRNQHLIEQSAHIWGTQRLDWFTQGFIKAEILKERLVITDLRMGFENNYVFSHAVAEIGNPHFHEIPTELLPNQLGVEDLALVKNKLFGL